MNPVLRVLFFVEDSDNDVPLIIARSGTQDMKRLPRASIFQ